MSTTYKDNKFDMSSIPLNSVIVIIGDNSTRKTALSKCILDNFIVKHSNKLKVKNIFLVSGRETFESNYKNHILEENFYEDTSICKTTLPTQSQRSKEQVLRNSIYHNDNSNKILICEPRTTSLDKNTLSSLEKDLCLDHKTSNITLIRTLECSFAQESHKNVKESHKNVKESHKNVSESHKNVSESHKNVSESHKNVKESHKNVKESLSNPKKNFKIGQVKGISNSLARLTFDKRLIPSILDYNLDILFIFSDCKLPCRNEKYLKFIYERYLNTFLGLFPTYKKFEEIFYSLKDDECFVYFSGKLYFYRLPEKYTSSGSDPVTPFPLGPFFHSGSDQQTFSNFVSFSSTNYNLDRLQNVKYDDSLLKYTYPSKKRSFSEESCGNTKRVKYNSICDSIFDFNKYYDQYMGSDTFLRKVKQPIVSIVPEPSAPSISESIVSEKFNYSDRIIYEGNEDDGSLTKYFYIEQEPVYSSILPDPQHVMVVNLNDLPSREINGDSKRRTFSPLGREGNKLFPNESDPLRGTVFQKGGDPVTFSALRSDSVTHFPLKSNPRNERNRSENMPNRPGKVSFFKKIINYIVGYLKK